MTLIKRAGFRAILAIPAMAALGLGLTAASASAATTAPAYGHHQECDEVLTYEQQGYGDPYSHGQVVVWDVCHVRIQEYGHYGHENEVVTYDQADRHGHLRFHIVFGVSDAHVYGGEDGGHY